MSLTNALLVLAIIVGGSILLVLPTMWLISQITPWRDLARRYPPREVLPVGSGGGPVRRGRAGWVWFGALGGYNGCIIWAADAEHLHLRLWPGFGAGHPPMSIPWPEVRFPIFDRTRGVRAGWGNMVEVVVGGDVTGRLPHGMVDGELEVRRAMLAAGGPAR